MTTTDPRFDVFDEPATAPASTSGVTPEDPPPASIDPNWTAAPPQDVPAEEAVLGAMLLSADAVNEAASVLRPDDFYRPAHEQIYLAALAVNAAGITADPMTVLNRLAADGNLSAVGGAPILHTLVERVPTVSNAGTYARTVANVAARRRLVEEGMRLVQRAYADGGDAAELATEARARLDQAVAATGAAGRTVGGALDNLISSLEHPLDLSRTIPYGWPDLDLIMRPMSPGQLIVVGARPSAGKTIFGVDVLRNVSIRSSIPGAIVSLEMAEAEISERILAAEARVPLARILSHTLDDLDWDRVAAVTGRLSGAPLTIEDAAGADLTRIRSVARRTKARVLVVDYLTLVRTRDLDSRVQAVGEVVRGLKEMAREEAITIVCLAQLNRDSEKRADKRPALSDLRESGEVEQAADAVILLHRPELHDPETARAGEIDAIIAKQRSGPTGTVPLGFQGHYARITNLGTWADAPPARKADVPGF